MLLKVFLKGKQTQRRKTMTKNSFTVWSKMEWKGRWTRLTTREIVEGLFSIENVDDLKGLVDDIEDEQDSVETSLEYLADGILKEGEDDITIRNMNQRYVRFDIEDVDEAKAFLKDIQDDLEAQKQMVKDFIEENDKF